MFKMNPNGHYNDEAYTTKQRPNKPTIPMTLYLWARSIPQLLIRFHRFKRVKMKGLKDPYIILSSHASYMDYKTAVKSVFPYRASNVAALDAYVHREKILKWAGAFGTRKFARDPAFARHVLHVLRHLKTPMIIYPEGKFTLDGRQSHVPASLGKLIKLAQVPVVTLINHGHHLALPYWHGKKRCIRSESVLTQVITLEEVKAWGVDEINQRLLETFHYDDYRWQKEKRLKNKKKDRAEGLENLLYQCMHCHTEGMMQTKGTIITCGHCQAGFELSVYGELIATTDQVQSISIAAWVDWQKAQIEQAIIEGTYIFETEAELYVIPNPNGFVRMGESVFKHDLDGLHLKFNLDGKPISVFKDGKTQYAVHVAYKHHHGKNCISYSVDNQTYFICFNDDSIPVTKIQFAVERHYLLKQPQSGNRD